MSRRYADPVEVRRGDDDPTEFLWRGRLYVVRAVLSRWTECHRWWRASSASLPGEVDDGEHSMWRVEASRGRAAGTGVFDLAFDWSRGAWFLARTLD